MSDTIDRLTGESAATPGAIAEVRAPRPHTLANASPARPGLRAPHPHPAPNPWAPYSPCTPHCVEHTAAQVSAAVTARRYADFGRSVTTTLTSRRASRSPEAIRHSARQLLETLGVRVDAGSEGAALRVQGGGATDPGTLVVADHISWLDPLALLACEALTLVAKREVGNWPVVGPLARRFGTCFIDRSGLRALPGAVAKVRDTLAAGHTVAVFPQGTTWCSAGEGPFRRAMFQAAIDAGAPVRPVTISYLQGGRPSSVPAFLGDDGFMPSLHRVARADGLTVRIRTHDPLLPTPGTDRRSLTARAQESVFKSQPSRHG